MVPLEKKRKKKKKGQTLHITGSTRVRFVGLARGVAASTFAALPCVAQRDVVVLALRNTQRNKGCFTSGIS